VCEVESFPVDSVDPIGAGDAFSAGIIESLNNRASGSISDALRMGCAAGAIATTSEGAFPGDAFDEDVLALLEG
jgi:sugar/nucleoside kinase (ribokinase family)